MEERPDRRLAADVHGRRENCSNPGSSSQVGTQVQPGVGRALGPARIFAPQRQNPPGPVRVIPPPRIGHAVSLALPGDYFCPLTQTVDNPLGSLPFAPEAEPARTMS